MKLLRQGDIVIKEVSSVPLGLTPVKSGIILYGEATGHKHQLVGGEVLINKEGVMYLVAKHGVKIVHEEHDTIPLKRGNYLIIRTREYDYTTRSSKFVVD